MLKTIVTGALSSAIVVSVCMLICEIDDIRKIKKQRDEEIERIEMLKEINNMYPDW